MKKKIIYLAIVAVIIAAVGLFIAYRMYNKPHPDFLSMKPDIEITADELFKAYTEDQQGAAARFNGKLIQVNGQPVKMEVVDSLVIAIYVMSEGMFGDEGIRCTFHPEQAAEWGQISPTEIPAIKGYCAGYNGSDVILEKCSVIR